MPTTKIFHADKAEINEKEFTRQVARPEHAQRIIPPENYTLMDRAGNLLAVHYVYPFDKCNRIQSLMGTIQNWVTAKRANGTMNCSKTFGFQPRNPTYTRDYCTAADLHFTNRPMVAALEELCRDMTEIYKQFAPDVYAQHEAWTSTKVLPDWRFAGTPFTSGIINNGNALRYHRDIGNIDGAWSNMLVLKNDVNEGNLILPEYRLGLEFTHGSVLMFNGSHLLHGVTPWTKKIASANRYSIVFYTLKEMCKCLTLGDERDRFRKIREEKENEKYLKLKESRQ